MHPNAGRLSEVMFENKSLRQVIPELRKQKKPCHPTDSRLTISEILSQALTLEWRRFTSNNSFNPTPR
jgi:hypothetical protein